MGWIIANIFTILIYAFLYASLMIGIPIAFNKMMWSIFDFVGKIDSLFLQDMIFILNGGNPIEILKQLKDG